MEFPLIVTAYVQFDLMTKLHPRLMFDTTSMRSLPLTAPLVLHIIANFVWHLCYMVEVKSRKARNLMLFAECVLKNHRMGKISLFNLRTRQAIKIWGKKCTTRGITEVRPIHSITPGDITSVTVFAVRHGRADLANHTTGCAIRT